MNTYNKYIMYSALALVVVAAIGYMVKTSDRGSLTYIADITGEVEELENELIELEALVSAGELTEAEAIERRDRIVSRLEGINASVEGANRASLTPQQRAQLSAALSQLSGILTTYRDSLVTLEEVAGESISRPQLNVRGSTSASNRSITELIEDTVVALEEHVEEVTGEEVDETSTDSEGETEDITVDESSEESDDMDESDESSSADAQEADVITDDESATNDDPADDSSDETSTSTSPDDVDESEDDTQ